MLIEDNSVADEIYHAYFSYSLLRYVTSRKNLFSAFSSSFVIYFVHELVGCKKKMEYNRELLDKMPEKEEEYKNSAFIVGDSVERRVLELLNAKTPFLAFKILDPSKNIVIVGSADGWYDNRPLEIKYRTSSCAPDDSHILQARIYAWLYGVDYSWLIVVSPKCIKSYKAYAVSETELKHLIEHWPSPRFAGECMFCPFATKCPYANAKTSTLISYVVDKSTT